MPAKEIISTRDILAAQKTKEDLIAGTI